MRVIKRIMFASLMVSVVCSASTVIFAEEFDRTGVSFGPRASFYDSKDGDGTWMGGAQLRIFPSHSFGLEASIDYRREDYPGETHIDVYPVQASLLGYIIPDGPVSLYGLAGAGWYITRVDRPSPLDDTDDDRFGLHAGGGLEIWLSELWSIDGSYRYIWLEDFTTRDADVLDKDYSDSGHQITAALNYYF